MSVYIVYDPSSRDIDSVWEKESEAYRWKKEKCPSGYLVSRWKVTGAGFYK